MTCRGARGTGQSVPYHGAGLTQANIALGKSSSLTVMAEDVESAAQAGFLCGHGCDEFQGFFIAEPVPAEEFARQLRTSMLTASSG